MTDIDKFILNSIDNCDTYEMLGEEIRSLQFSLLEEYFVSNDPVYELLLTLIDKYETNKELGFYVNKIKNKLENYFTN
jgi:hypothetical protein